MSTKLEERNLSNKISTQERTACAVCAGGNLTEIIALPQLPLTGIYVQGHEDDDKYPMIDQTFELCEGCGHGQLGTLVDQKYLYEDTYTHRGSESPLAIGVNEFFAAWLSGLTEGHTFGRVLDVGCGDLYLLRLLSAKRMGRRLLGVDPIWRGRDHETSEGITVRGAFINEVDVSQELGGAPDLIISNHTFEHMVDVGEQLQSLMNLADERALLVVEVPSFDSLLTMNRFDQVFHQHVNYFSVASFRRLITEAGGQYVSHTHNYGFWGGSLLIAFRKGFSEEVTVDEERPTLTGSTRSFELFKAQLAILMELIDRVEEPILGYGAAQILPILAYHMRSDLSFLKAILDDDHRREGLGYPHLAVSIRRPEPGDTLEHAAVMITALDSVRPLVKAAAARKARRIIVPLHVLG